MQKPCGFGGFRCDIYLGHTRWLRGPDLNQRPSGYEVCPRSAVRSNPYKKCCFATFSISLIANPYLLDWLQKFFHIKEQVIQNWRQCNILFLRLCVMAVLRHRHKISIVPFFDFRVSFQRIWRTEPNGMAIKSKHSCLPFIRKLNMITIVCYANNGVEPRRNFLKKLII